MDELPDFDSPEWQARLDQSLARHEELSAEPASEDSVCATEWKRLPEEVKRFGLSVNRYARLLALDAPEVVLDHERGLLRPRIAFLRRYLDVLENGLDA